MRFAYADPPYIGQAKSRYGENEVDHARLIAELMTFDGWALSASSTSLQTILPLCPKGTRIGAWVKPWCSWKGIPPISWEPLLFLSSVKPANRKSKQPDWYYQPLRDWLSCNAKGGVLGCKPSDFLRWMLGLLGTVNGDEIHELFVASAGLKELADEVGLGYVGMTRWEK